MPSSFSLDLKISLYYWECLSGLVLGLVNQFECNFVPLIIYMIGISLVLFVAWGIIIEILIELSHFKFVEIVNIHQAYDLGSLNFELSLSTHL